MGSPPPLLLQHAPRNLDRRRFSNSPGAGVYALDIMDRFCSGAVENVAMRTRSDAAGKENGVETCKTSHDLTKRHP